MQCLEGDWIDGALASRPCSTTGCPILWQVYINEHHTAECWADYVPADNAKIEYAFTTGKTPVQLGTGGDTWTIDFQQMMQVSDKPRRTQRPIRRIVIVASEALMK